MEAASLELMWEVEEDWVEVDLLHRGGWVCRVMTMEEADWCCILVLQQCF
jgi:hypothetical protein